MGNTARVWRGLGFALLAGVSAAASAAEIVLAGVFPSKAVLVVIVLAVAGRLSDEHDARLRGALAEHRLRRVAKQPAAAAAGRGGARCA